MKNVNITDKYKIRENEFKNVKLKINMVYQRVYRLIIGKVMD